MAIFEKRVIWVILMDVECAMGHHCIDGGMHLFHVVQRLLIIASSNRLSTSGLHFQLLMSDCFVYCRSHRLGKSFPAIIQYIALFSVLFSPYIHA